MSVILFVMDGCGFCVKAKSMFKKEIDSGEMVLKPHTEAPSGVNGFPTFMNTSSGKKHSGLPASKHKLYEIIGVVEGFIHGGAPHSRGPPPHSRGPPPHSRGPQLGRFSFACSPGLGCHKLNQAPGPGTYSNWKECAENCDRPPPHSRGPQLGGFSFACSPGIGCHKLNQAPGPGTYSNWKECAENCDIDMGSHAWHYQGFQTNCCGIPQVFDQTGNLDPYVYNHETMDLREKQKVWRGIL